MLHRLVRGTAMTAAALLVVGLAGCYESPNVSLNEPGVYKGAVDPLLAKMHNQDLREGLRTRFRYQTDR